MGCMKLEKKNIEDQFASCREAFDEIDKIEEIGDTSGIKLTYESQSPLNDAVITGERIDTVILVSSQDIAQAYNQISDANYGSKGGEFLLKYTLDFVSKGITSMIELNVNPNRSTDVFGRPLYIEKGYSIKEASREISSNNAWTEVEFFVYDRDQNEVYHDCYILVTYTD